MAYAFIYFCQNGVQNECIALGILLDAVNVLVFTQQILGLSLANCVLSYLRGNKPRIGALAFVKHSSD